ncbi:MAG TPA: hypothetical protein VK553_02010 [Candidatus Nitrosopolaris rasttigaisensis]|nr:hypothetical protein [Candidatus Nitrosopolaris rasttigaisensis]
MNDQRQWNSTTLTLASFSKTFILSHIPIEVTMNSIQQYPAGLAGPIGTKYRNHPQDYHRN